MKKLLLASVAAAALVAPGIVGRAHATITVYSGVDDGAPTSGPFPNSAAAQASFLAALGPSETATFAGVPLGFYSPIAAAPGLSITLTGTDFGAGFSGVTDTTFGNLYGFSTVPGVPEYLGTSGDVVTFNFSTPTHGLGFYLTGLQTVFTATLTLTFTDSAPETLSLPITVNGGAEYFGFTDTIPITSATLTDVATISGTDAWGIDDISFGAPKVPEPASLMLLGAGLVGLGLVRRRRSS